MFKTIFMGGDTDTNACIVASLASALYEIDNSLIEKTNQKLPDEFKKVLIMQIKKLLNLN